MRDPSNAWPTNGSWPASATRGNRTNIDCGKSLLVLDTASADAERLYARAGWVRVGIIPDYALLPSGGYCDTIVFYRDLSR